MLKNQRFKVDLNGFNLNENSQILIELSILNERNLLVGNYINEIKLVI